ncbi:MAG TPA: hypothetical protein VLE73_05655 [Candidatus Saccharimonadales bacterium]|nr:hypothetical protein [Candidatus Saccharimonadales bacterium]
MGRGSRDHGGSTWVGKSRTYSGASPGMGLTIPTTEPSQLGWAGRGLTRKPADQLQHIATAAAATTGVGYTPLRYRGGVEYLDSEALARLLKFSKRSHKVGRFTLAGMQEWAEGHSHRIIPYAEALIVQVKGLGVVDKFMVANLVDVPDANRTVSATAAEKHELLFRYDDKYTECQAPEGPQNYAIRLGSLAFEDDAAAAALAVHLEQTTVPATALLQSFRYHD